MFLICFVSLSGSSCSLAAGLESLGLTDIRTLVRLMCLAAAGRAGLSTGLASGPGALERPRGANKPTKPISCLAYLSTAVGCLASNSPNAAKLLVQLCTQVSTLLSVLVLILNLRHLKDSGLHLSLVHVEPDFSGYGDEPDHSGRSDSEEVPTQFPAGRGRGKQTHHVAKLCSDAGPGGAVGR